MIISHGRRYIFVHAPKTGGTSLALALEARAMKDDIMLGDTPKAKRRRHRVKDMPSSGRLWKHSTLRDIDGLVTQADIEAFFVFTLVRNPWDRVVSYYHWLRSQNFAHPAVGIAKATDFSGFLRDRVIRSSLSVHSYGSYVSDGAGVDRCDLFLRLEHINEDLALLNDHLGFELGPLPHANRSDRRQDFRFYYDDEDAGIVADTCAEDIDRFKYHFEQGG
ncbi:MAG: sulfotransferase family protein [Rhodobacteraceae bacterium]|nr:sulfotransferase family protein [Paracoccaceae bacterium]